LRSSFFKDSRHLSLYSSFTNEVLTDEILARAVKEGKDVYYPSVVRGVRHLEFFKVREKSELSPGSYDIPEPASRHAQADPGVFDLVVVPGVVFDTRGARLGFGKGYYDRALKGLGCRVVGLAFEFQVLEGEKIPLEAHDIRVEAIVTEKRIIRC